MNLAQSTLNDMKKVERLLQYVSRNQNNATRYYGSNMQLQVQSDASYLSRPKAKSVLGGYHYLGFYNRTNGPIFCHYPQLPTTVMIDNTVAEGLAADTINAKRSKSMDVRFFWLRDRIRKGQFEVRHIAGRWNISDFFTKSLPREKFMQFLPLPHGQPRLGT